MSAGTKHDAGKPMMSLLDAYVLGEVAKVLTFGAQKYSRHNWRKGIEVSRLLDAGLRHVFAFSDGEDLDEETQLSHLAHAMCCLMFAMWTVRHRPDFDDRWKPEPPVAVTPEVINEFASPTSITSVLNEPDVRAKLTDHFSALMPPTTQPPDPATPAPAKE